MGEEGLSNLIMDTVTVMERNGYAGGYVESVVKVVKSWLAYNRKEIKRRIKINCI